MKKIRKILFYLLTFAIVFASSGYTNLCNCEKLKKQEKLTQSNCCCKPVEEKKSCCTTQSQDHSSEKKQENTTKICPGKYVKAKQENNSHLVNTNVVDSKIDLKEIDLIDTELAIDISKIPRYLKFLRIKNLTNHNGKDFIIEINQLKIPAPIHS